VDAPVRRRRDRIVHVQVPQLGAPRALVRCEQILELIEVVIFSPLAGATLIRAEDVGSDFQRRKGKP
jgi:hypothetical protein